jgi:hypothetical protein
MRTAATRREMTKLKARAAKAEAIAERLRVDYDILAARYETMRLSVVAPLEERAARAEKRAEKVESETVSLLERLMRYGLLDEISELRMRVDLIERSHANFSAEQQAEINRARADNARAAHAIRGR